MSKVLIIDDDQMLCKAMAALVKTMGHEAKYAHTLKSGLACARSESFDVVLLDVYMPDGNGLDLLPKIREMDSNPEVIIITASGDADAAELAIKCGAWDYIEKTASIKEIMSPFSRVLQYRKEKTSKTAPISLKRERIIGNSPKMKACLGLVEQAVTSQANVLITGETGTGKELFARAIHTNKPRNSNIFLSDATDQKHRDKEYNFIVVDCTALPESLVESLLFGHEKGAFTGADRAREGLFKQADGGTLFLDEVGELPLSIQKSFLRVLQERRFRPVGGKQEINSHFRLIAATNRDLDLLVEKKRFRKDLLFRLRSINIELPSLKDRKEDIEELARFQMKRLCDQYDMKSKGFAPEFFQALTFYDWPGNVRELVNTIDSSLAAAMDDPTLHAKHLPLNIRICMARAPLDKKKHSPTITGSQKGPDTHLPPLRDYRNLYEKQYLQELIRVSSGDMKKACVTSKVSRSRLYELLAKHQISLPNT